MTGRTAGIGEYVWVEPVFWRSIFVKLLETALMKRCKTIRVSGAHQVDKFYVSDSFGGIGQKDVAVALSVPPSVGSTSSTSSPRSSAESLARGVEVTSYQRDADSHSGICQKEVHVLDQETAGI